jgi:hypothetical protein
MFQTLVQAIRARQPALLAAPFTVGEIHQQILPYRHFRRELGIDTNQEYELVLMELLSGARGYLDVDERLKDELGKELTSASPEPSRVRSYADAQVTLNAAAVAKLPQSRLSGPAVTPGLGGARMSTPSGVAADFSSPHCRYCGGELPMGRPLHFCPNCGQNLQVKNCPACGAEVETGWKFCVSCGKGVS